MDKESSGQTLYVSDLDGTLLCDQGQLSAYTRDVIRRFVGQGGLFTIATARTPQTARSVIHSLDLQLPMLLNSGAIIYDPVADDYIDVVTIPPETVQQLYEIFARMNITGFMYTLEDREIRLSYQKLRDPEDMYYYDSRFRIYGDQVYNCVDLVEAARQHNPMFFVVYGRPQRLTGIHKELMRVPGISCSLCEDVYSGGEYFFIDIFSDQVSKSKGMKRLQKMVGANRVAAFGDNFNDLDMLEAADEAYVPENGVGAAKKIALKILPRCEEDGVAKFLESLM